MTETTPSRSSLCGRAAPHPLVVLFFAGATLIAGPSLAGAQTTPVIEVGSRVRVTALIGDLSQVVGSVRKVTEEELVIRFESPYGLWTLQRSLITELDVSTGREGRQPVKSMGIGLMGGFACGALIGFASGDDESGFIRFTAEDKALMAGGLLGVLGGLIGLTGVFAGGKDVWVPVDPAGAAVILLPMVAGEGTGLRFGFSIPIR